MKIIIFFMLISTQVFAGHEVNNGGYMVFCPVLGEFSSFDYVMEVKNHSRDALVKTNNPMARISKLLSLKAPSLHASFDEFVNHLKNESDSSRPYIWVESLYDLPEVHDADFGYLPSWCRMGDFGGVQIIQAVVRKKITVNPDKSRIIFYYDSRTMLVLSPLQKSFLLVHEWLWNFTSNAGIGRKVNFFLHSRDFDNLTKEQVEAKFKSLGFNI